MNDDVADICVYQIVDCIHQCRRRLDRISLAGHGVSVMRPSAEDIQHALVTLLLLLFLLCMSHFTVA